MLRGYGQGGRKKTNFLFPLRSLKLYRVLELSGARMFILYTFAPYLRPVKFGYRHD